MMSKIVRRVCPLLAVLCIVLQPSVAAEINTIACTAATVSDCTAIDTNATCDTDIGKCKCTDGYTLSADNTTCIKVLGSPCTSSNAGTVCTIPHSHCATANVCACEDNFKEADTLCTTILGTACTSANAGVCTGTNSVCTNDVCACSEYYKSKDGACVTILSNDCETNAACEAVSNSECKENMCKCMSGYMMSSDTLCIEVLEAACASNDTCDTLTNSICIDGKCACAENYDVAGKVCLKGSEQSCTVDSECASGKCEGETGSKTCSKKSAASSVTAAAGLVVMAIFVTLFQHFF